MNTQTLINIINEELNQVILEKSVKSIVNAVANDKTTKKTFNVLKNAFQNKQISINDLIGVSKGLYHGAKSGKKSADIAVENPSALQKLGLNIVVGDITQGVDDISRYAGKESEAFVGKTQDRGRTYGAKLVFSI